MSQRGLYLCVEGVDGSGKTTVVLRIVDILKKKGTPVIAVREPGSTPAGERIRELLLGHPDIHPWAEAALFCAQRAQLVNQVIRPALDRGVWVVSDRGLYSSVAYQGAGRGLGEDAVLAFNLIALQGMTPDLTAVLDVDPELAWRREKVRDRISSEGIGFQTRVRAAYRRLAERDRSVELFPEGDPDEIAERVAARALELSRQEGGRRDP